MDGMRYFTGYLFLFILGSMIGWVIEVFYRRLFSAKKWINPGFLNGPYLPLYGFGVVIMYAVSDLPIAWWWKLLLFLVLMTAIEYVAGIIFIKGMNIKLWDYSEEWANVQGIICPKFSLFWTALGAAFLFLIYPPFKVMFEWVGNHAYMCLPIGLLYGILLTDLGLSLDIAAKIRAAAKKAKQIVAYEKLKSYIADENKQIGKKRSFLFPFKSKINLREHISSFIEKHKKINKQ